MTDTLRIADGVCTARADDLTALLAALVVDAVVAAAAYALDAAAAGGTYTAHLSLRRPPRAPLPQPAPRIICAAMVSTCAGDVALRCAASRMARGTKRPPMRMRCGNKKRSDEQKQRKKED